eukprot:CAMPEP_0172816752 /NCGR_PEP_ID=MMETSP1075-20121228/12698_1 /TAXON_ID=2916 /ORGANISM="Ceratium fusus, Strain PA161109" /LENGTH=113 /DNA_ID=CAMNT_0013656813 /DNA_START=50 /DNA_END=389 /DNA_ORIENTATION=+
MSGGYRQPHHEGNVTSDSTVPVPYPVTLLGISLGECLPLAWDCALQREHHVHEVSALWTQCDSGMAAIRAEEPWTEPKQLFCPDEPLDVETANEGVPRAWMSPAPCAAWTPSP